MRDPAALLSLLFLAGCAPNIAPAPVPSARAALVDRSGAVIGHAAFTYDTAGLRVRVSVAGLTPGEHGIHIHETGACEPPDFTSAGSHLKRPGFDSPHGLRHPSGGEAGDMSNLRVDAAGRASATLGGSEQLGDNAAPSIIGRALVIHAQPDDQISQPSGGSGERVACGVIRSTR